MIPLVSVVIPLITVADKFNLRSNCLHFHPMSEEDDAEPSDEEDVQSIPELVELYSPSINSKRRLSLSVFLSEMIIHIEFTDDGLGDR